ncbi:hypothetical protein ES703_40797 [subsurface metagenome]
MTLATSSITIINSDTMLIPTPTRLIGLTTLSIPSAHLVKKDMVYQS